VKAPEVVTRPILLPAASVNHRLPSGPTVMPVGALSGVGTGYSVKREAACAGEGAPAMIWPISTGNRTRNRNGRNHPDPSPTVRAAHLG